MRTYREPIAVETGDTALPAPRKFCWRGRLWVVTEIIATWAEAGSWWLEEAIAEPVERRCWRVSARTDNGTAGTFELADHQRHWWLRGMLDCR